MADQNEQQSCDRMERTNVGHVIVWNMALNDLAHLQSQPFSKTFETRCETSPSSWRFKMNLTKVGDDGTSSFSVRLERNDSTELELHANIWIDIYDLSDNPIFKKQAMIKTGILARSSEIETVEMTPLPNMRDAIHQNLKVFVTLKIFVCHVDHESD